MIEDYYHAPKVVIKDFHAFLNSDPYDLSEDGTAFSGSESHHDEGTGLTYSTWLRLTRE